MHILKILFVFLISFNTWAYPKIPDISKSPGHICTIFDKDFFEFRYSEKIPYCKRNVSSAIKKYIYEIYSIPFVERENYTIDHIIPLSIWGSNGIKNLWPEHKEVKKTRPTLELDVYNSLKDSNINQDQAINIILIEKYKIN
jgi:hypothetical protein